MALQKVSLVTATKYTTMALKSGLVPYIAGSPGAGKSAMIHAVAADKNLLVVDIRLSQEDPTTINGFPDVANGRSDYLPPVRFPLKDKDQLPLLPKSKGKEAEYEKVLATGDKAAITAFQEANCYKGWLIFFDELPSAARSIQAASYKIILDRLIGVHPLHPAAFIVAAGNLTTDNAIVNEMGTALKSRLVHVHVESNPQSYLNLISTKLKFDSRIVSYLAYQKNKVNTFNEFNKGSADETFACERTWEFVNKILKANCPDETKPIPDEMTTLLCGTVGSTAIEFVQYTEAFKDLPTLDQILATPTTCEIPQANAVKWLLTGMLVGSSDMKNVPTLMKYVNRLPKEFKFIYVKMLWGKADEFLSIKEVEEAFNDIGDMMLA